MKSVYSVILSDELVRRLDAVAYENEVSRSVMLNKILADYLMVETPDTVMENIFTSMENLFGAVSGMRFVNQASISMASVMSALDYRYNPKIKYSVELFPAGDLGQLKISLRSQNPVLIDLLEGFYSFFISLEEKYIGKRTYGYGDNRFVRILLRPNGLSPKKMGEEITSFVVCFDKLLRTFFANLSDIEYAKKRVENEYLLQLKSKEVLL
ncbi:MAG: hypothetical protein E7360_05620 [Clostridiales bacterium]|nr:hypothetical protein [Clostridiales bacterium]